MANTAYATPSTQVGLGIETTRNTAATIAYWAKVTSPTYKPNLTIIEDTTLQGSMVPVYDAITGMRYDSHGWSTHPYMDILPVYVRAELGSTDTLVTAPTNTTLASSCTANAATVSLTATAAAGTWIVIDTGTLMETRRVNSVTGAGPYTATLNFPTSFAHGNGATVAGLTAHGYSLLNNTGSTGNQPPSVTIVDNDGEEWRQMTGCQLDKLDLKITPNKSVDMSVNWFGNAATTAAPSASFTSESMPTPWTVMVAIGGTPLNYVESIDFSFARGVKPIEAFTGTSAYYNYFAGPMASSAKISVIEQSGAPEISQYLAGTKQTLEVMLADRQTGWATRLYTTKAMFGTADLSRGKEYITASLDFKLLPSATDATAGGVSPVRWEIANATTTSI